MTRNRLHDVLSGPLAVRKVLLPLGALVLLFIGFSLARTATYGSVQPPKERSPDIAILEGAVERLAGAVRTPTISHEDPDAFDSESFRALHAYLEASFPAAHSQLQRETVQEHSLLYTWPGTDPSLKAILLMGHLDVVPTEPGTEKEWHEPPFAGRIAEGFVWGRGAIDDKSAVVGTLEAVEMLLREGFRPTRTVYLAYGHDEEVGGNRGAREIARLLEHRGVQLEMVLDEGGVIGDGLVPGISAPVALVGIAEKGFVTVELTARAAGGHSSLPPRQSAIGVLGAAIAHLEEAQMPARLAGPTRQFFDRIGPSLPSAQRVMFANLWLTRSLVIRALEGNPSMNAMVRTTTASTVFQGGSKDNVLPTQARALVNFRILPGDSTAGVLEHVRRTVRDRRVGVKMAGRFSAEPSAVSSTGSESYRRLERAIGSVHPDAIVAPYLVVVTTDARHFSGLTNCILRFLPVRITSADLERMHGTNERIAVENYLGAIRTYRQLIVYASGA